jgi:hypothetical protein
VLAALRPSGALLAASLLAALRRHASAPSVCRLAVSRQIVSQWAVCWP